MDTNGLGKNNYNSAVTGRTTEKTSKPQANEVKGQDASGEIGSPQLSEKAQKYYDQLKKKFSNMDFILVSKDKKEEVQANLSQYANSKKMVVLIDTEKIEKMSEDEVYRKKFEGIISGSTAQIAQLKTQLGSSASSVRTYGMKFNDGGNASFFAVIDKSLISQKKRIAKKAAEKAQDKKEAKKAAEKELEKEKKAERAKSGKTDQYDGQDDTISDGDIVTVTASSMEELLKKINDVLNDDINEVLTDTEKKIGQHINFTV